MSLYFFKELNVESNNYIKIYVHSYSYKNICYYLWKNTMDIGH